jgi:nitrogen fixation NifU-like protein
LQKLPIMDVLRELYQEVILDHHKRPRNRREMPEASAKASGHNPLCGDRVSVFVRMDGNVLQDVSFVGTGCAISQASASMMTEKVKGLPVKDAIGVTESIKRMMAGEEEGDANTLGDLISLKGVVKYPVRIKCALLGWNTLLEALEESES